MNRGRGTATFYSCIATQQHSTRQRHTVLLRNIDDRRLVNKKTLIEFKPLIFLRKIEGGRCDIDRDRICAKRFGKGG
jgi:hypothetical protein